MLSLQSITECRETHMSTPRQPRRSWPYVVAAVLVLAVQQGWDAAAVTKLAAVLLVLVALIHAAGPGNQ
jgi:hypothetical protein